jgi:pimeloyl-ACP methyl ester carboxylesterase
MLFLIVDRYIKEKNRSTVLTKSFINIELNSLPELSLKAAYWERGKGQTILLLHGFMAKADYWLPSIDLLSSQYRCIALDLLGFGDSSQPKITYNLAIQVDFIQQIVVQFNLEKIIIMGHSFGSWVAAAYALKYPETVASLILTAPAGIRDDSFTSRYRYLKPLLWESKWVDRGLNLLSIAAAIVGKKAAIDEIKYIRRELLNQPVARDFLQSRMKPEAAIDTVEKEIHRLNVPTLVIAGELDETIPLWHSETYTKEISRSRLEIIAGADHKLPQNYAGEMVVLVRDFLTDSN